MVAAGAVVVAAGGLWWALVGAGAAMLTAVAAARPLWPQALLQRFCYGCGRGSLGGRGAALLAVVAAGAAVVKKFRWSKFRPKKQPNILVVL